MASSSPRKHLSKASIKKFKGGAATVNEAALPQGRNIWKQQHHTMADMA
eukprot:CAMPEP_0185575678 /NCGR_PEP_ID=MMETSP0434-20130131/6807_1 /TAXON_ID=626734 ORGANISM="Favella taraikaensis, Strain Fe Narragansett Bay" /NCGR_SAMPLE_ID=MMETSP0434 /ASSEMBLY_ACC=CAM_ASM_000379 /LENGTH=48 /DNA_ID= /DNA_START= /DNA_END= /DNA_ORIENTATION=